MEFIKIPIKSDILKNLPLDAVGVYYTMLRLYAAQGGKLKNDETEIIKIIKKNCTPQLIKLIISSGLFIVQDDNLINADIQYQIEENEKAITEGEHLAKIQEAQMLIGKEIGDPPKRKKKKMEKAVITKHSEAIIDVLQYLNECTGRSFRLNSAENHKQIISLLEKKYTAEDIKSVIRFKSKEWLNTDFQQYLRPETLFGKKFEGYLNQAQHGTSKADKTTNLYHSVGTIKFVKEK